MKSLIVFAALLATAPVAYGVSLGSADETFGLPRCVGSPVLKDGVPLRPQPKLCVVDTDTGAYVVAPYKPYSLRCASYDCAAKAKAYHRTGLVPQPIPGD